MCVESVVFMCACSWSRCLFRELNAKAGVTALLGDANVFPSEDALLKTKPFSNLDGGRTADNRTQLLKQRRKDTKLHVLRATDQSEE